MNSETTPQNRAFGIACGVGQSVFLVSTSSLVRMTSEFHNTVEIFFYRSVVIMIIGYFILKSMGKLQDVMKTNHKMQMIRAILGVITTLFAFYCYTLLPIAQAQLFFFISPIIIVALSYPVLGEKVGLYRSAAVVIGFIGTFILLQPGTLDSTWGAIIGVGVTLSYAAVTICLRFMGKTEDAYITIFYFAVVSVVVAIPFLPFFMVMPTLEGLLYVTLIGFSAFGVQFCITNAYKHAPAAIIAPLIYLNLIFALGIDYVIWGDVPNITMMIGALIIIAANVIILWREQVKKKKLSLKAKVL